METPAAPVSPATPTSQPKPASKPRPAGFFYQLQLILGAALVLATLFTAWTPGEGNAPRASNDSAIEAGLPPTVTSPGGPTPTRRAKPLIGIVSGHWGNDSGSVCSDGLTEAQVNQNIAALVQKDLAAKGYDVDLLREFDNRLKGYQATVLVSIHNDSCDYINDQATGFKVASAMANSHPERAARLTACIRNRYALATGLPLHSTSVTNDMTSYHAFGEIDDNTTAAIIETGFLNLDRQFLTQHTDKVAMGIVNGIICYLNNENIAPLPPTSAPQLTEEP